MAKRLLTKSTDVRRSGRIVLHSVLAALLADLAGAAGVAPGVEAATAVSHKTVRVLAIGNSFTQNATAWLPDIVKESGHVLVLAKATIGGCPLEKHHALAMLHEADPEAAEGKPYFVKGDKGSKTSLQDLLTSEKWQFITIQQASPISFTIATYRPHARNLYDYVKKYAPEAEVVFHQTWAYREDDTQLFKNGFDAEKMYRGLTTAYHTIAREIGIKRIIPVGNAFRLATESPDWKFASAPDYDFKNPPYPALPAQKHSLHAGYDWKNGPAGKHLSLDSHHANAAGEYLGGCVWYEFFFGEDVRKIKFKPKNLDEQDAEFLRGMAHQAATEGAKPAAWPAELDGATKAGENR